MEFPGQIRLPEIDHPGVPATFVVDDAHAEVLLDDESLGRWSLYDVTARRLVASAFEVDLGDEEITFLADDPIDFAYRGVEHMAEAWARFKAMRMPRRMIAVSRSRKGTKPSRISELRAMMESNLEAAGADTVPGDSVETAVVRPVPPSPPPRSEQPVAQARSKPSFPETEPAPGDPTSQDETRRASAHARELEEERRQLEEERRRLEEERRRHEEERRRHEEQRAEAIRRDEERRRAIAEEMATLEQKRRDAERLLELERTEADRLEKAAEEAARIEEERRRLEEERAALERAEEERKAELDQLDAEREAARMAEEQREAELQAELDRLEEERLVAEAAAEEGAEEPEELPAEEPAEEPVAEESPAEEPAEDAESAGTAEKEPESLTVDLDVADSGEEDHADGADQTPPSDAPEPEPAMAAVRDRSGLVGAVKSAFARGSKAHEHRFVEAAGGLGIVRYVCEECGYVSISVND